MKWYAACIAALEFAALSAVLSPVVPTVELAQAPIERVRANMARAGTMRAVPMVVIVRRLGMPRLMASLDAVAQDQCATYLVRSER